MIKRFRIQNFKSLRDVTVDLDPLTVLIGRGGAGKSNFVDALRFLRRYLTDRNDQFITQGGGWHRFFCATAVDDAVRFEITFDLKRIEGEVTYFLELGLQKGIRRTPGNSFNMQLRAERLSVAGRPVFAHAEGKWETPPASAIQPNPSQTVLGHVYGIPEVQHAYHFLTKSIACYDFPGNVLVASQPAQNVLFAKSPGTAAGTPSLADDGENYLAAFEAIVTDLASETDVLGEVVVGLQRLTPTIRALELNTQLRNEILVGHTLGQQSLSFDLSQQSEGFRRFLAHLIALYQVPPKQTLVFEEPEKGIYPGALATLAEYFISLAGRRSQIILTTHNPRLLDHFEPDSVRVVEMRDYETRIGPLAKDQMAAVKDRLMRTGELLTVTEARIAENPSQSAGGERDAG